MSAPTATAGATADGVGGFGAAMDTVMASEAGDATGTPPTSSTPTTVANPAPRPGGLTTALFLTAARTASGSPATDGSTEIADAAPAPALDVAPATAERDEAKAEVVPATSETEAGDVTVDGSPSPPVVAQPAPTPLPIVPTATVVLGAAAAETPSPATPAEPPVEGVSPDAPGGETDLASPTPAPLSGTPAERGADRRAASDDATAAGASADATTTEDATSTPKAAAAMAQSQAQAQTQPPAQTAQAASPTTATTPPQAALTSTGSTTASPDLAAQAAWTTASAASPGLSAASAQTTVQIAAQISRRLEGRSTRFEMAMTPEGLGRVEISLDIGSDGKLAAQFAFDNPLAATELRGRADELRRQLTDAGFQLAQDALSFSERDPNASGGGADQRFRQAGRAFAGGARLGAEAEAVAAPAPWISLSLTPRGVDLKV